MRNLTHSPVSDKSVKGKPAKILNLLTYQMTMVVFKNLPKLIIKSQMVSYLAFYAKNQISNYYVMSFSKGRDQ